MSAPKLRLIRSDIVTILRKKRWFSDGIPIWPKAKQRADVIGLSKKWVKRLRRKNNGQPPPSAAQLVLAERLEKCRPWARCKSGACPKCGRAFQRWTVAEIVRLSKGLTK